MSERLVILSGPSGVGKSSMIALLRDRLPHIRLSVSATTRRPRQGEVDGVHYTFLSEADFRRGLAASEFLEWAEVHGNLYGTPKKSVQTLIEQGFTVILDIDVQGFHQVRRLDPRIPACFITPPSLAHLRSRLEARGSETPETLDKRLRAAEREMAAVKEYDLVIVNDDLERATTELEHWIRSFELGSTPGHHS